MRAIDATTALRAESTLGIVVKRACPACRAIHPLARTPPLPPGACPDCGAALPPPEEIETVPAVLTGFRGRLAMALLAAGRFFHSLANKGTRA